MTQTSRRTFLKTAALTGAASVLAAEHVLAETTLVSVPAGPLQTLFGGRRRGGGMTVTASKFGETSDGKTVNIYKLDNGRGITVEVLSLEIGRAHV